VGLYFRFHRKNITGVEVIQFLRLLLRHMRRPVVVVWDGGTIHHRRLVRDYLADNRSRLRVYRFPAYAPELNPDEYVWTQSKRELTNGTPQDIDELDEDLGRAIHHIRCSQRLLWACIHKSHLPL
jgi:transposase